LEDAVYETHYVEIEGVWHEAAEDETTACGLVIPIGGTPWTREQPAKVHCGENATKAAPKSAEEPAEAPKTTSKAKAKK
jgi:hypothetical protein